MARVVVTSDLHLGITDHQTLELHAERIAAERPDLTVLAGDIGEGLENFRACLAIFRDLPGEVAVLAGNHDVWARLGQTSKGLWERALQTATRAAGMLWLEGDVWTRDGLGVAGSIAWYDYSAAEPSLNRDADYWAANKGRWNMDYRMVDWSWSDVDFAARAGDGLVEQVSRLEAAANVSATLVVTHVPLFEEQMERRPWDPRWTAGNAYFGHFTLGERLLPFATLRCVISGHTHVARASYHARGEGAPLPVWVVDSDYGRPGFITYDYPESS